MIIQNILKDSNYCFDSLAIRLQSKDLKTPYPRNRTPGLQGYHKYKRERKTERETEREM